MVPELVSVMGTPTSQCSPPTGHGPCQDADPQPDSEPGGGGWAEGLCRTLACTRSEPPDSWKTETDHTAVSKRPRRRCARTLGLKRLLHQAATEPRGGRSPAHLCHLPPPEPQPTGPPAAPRAPAHGAALTLSASSIHVCLRSSSSIPIPITARMTAWQVATLPALSHSSAS